MNNQNKPLKEFFRWILSFAIFLIVMLLVFYILSYLLILAGGLLIIFVGIAFLYGLIKK